MTTEVERRRRWDDLRKAMSNHGIDVLVIAGREGLVGRGYIRYLTDWHVWNGVGYLVFPLSSEPKLVLGSNSQAHWAARIGWVRDIRAAKQGSAVAYDVAVPSRNRAIDEVIRILKSCKGNGNIGLVGVTRLMSFDDVQALRAHYRITHSDFDIVVDRMRMNKSYEEHLGLRETAQIAVRAMQRFHDVLAPGKTEREVVAQVWEVCHAYGVLDGIVHLSHENPPFIRPPSERVITSDDVIKTSVEIAGPTGYWIELGAVFSFRSPPQEQLRIFNTTVKAIELVRSSLRPNVSAREVAAIAERAFIDDGWSDRHRVFWDANGIGLDVIEPPILSADSDATLVDGVVINVHPAIAVGNSTIGFYIRDNYVVSESGGKSLSGWAHSWQLL